MATVSEILSRYRYVRKNGAAHQAEQVDARQGGQLADAAQPVAIWDKEEHLGQTPPDEVLAQTAAVRAMLGDPGFSPNVALGASSTFMIGDTKNNRPGVDATRCIMFLDRKDPRINKTLIAELDAECKQAKAAIAMAPDEASRSRARGVYMQHMAFKHLMNGREGPTSAINTYDDQIFTWGMGYGAVGLLPKVLDRIYAIEQEAAPDDIEQHPVQKLFYLCGFKFNGKYWVVDTDKKKVYASRKPDVNADDDAFRYIHDTLAFHAMWVLLARDDRTRKTLVQAQREIFFEHTGRVAQGDKIQTGALYTLLSHFQHWTGEPFDWVGWATGPNARPKVTEPLPSEKGDAQIAIQAIHRLYHKRSPNHDKNGFDSHTRNYWAQMVGEDTQDEGLTDFHPKYSIMTADKVDAVPADHLAAKTKDGRYYDLGPLDDFCRSTPAVATPPALRANWVEQDPRELLPGPVRPSPPPPAPPVAPLPEAKKETSWWSFFIRPPSWESCFARGTAVSCPSGPRPIEELCEGDEVLAYDAAAGTVVAARVLRVLVHPPAPCLELHVEGAARIGVTESHPVLVRGEWRPAGHLRPGDEVLMLDGRKLVPRKVLALGLPGPAEGEVFDLTVADHHTFFAGAVLVHNKLP